MSSEGGREQVRMRSPGLHLAGLGSGFVRAALTVDVSHLSAVHTFLANRPASADTSRTGASAAVPTASAPPRDDTSVMAICSDGAALLHASPYPQCIVAGVDEAGNCTLGDTDRQTDTNSDSREHGNVHPHGAGTNGHATAPQDVVLTSLTTGESSTPSELTVLGTVRLMHYEAVTETPTHAQAPGGLVCLYAVSDRVILPESGLAALLEPFAATAVRCIVCAEPRYARALVLIWFVSPDAGHEFVDAMNGQPFDSEFGSERCHVLVLSDFVVGTSAPAVTWGLASCFEIPRCPVCLERLDHTMEPALLQPPLREGALAPCWRRMWERCGACALLDGDQRDMGGTDGRGDRDNHPRCHDCGESHRLWACMVCAYVGCSRPQYGADADVGMRSRKGHMLEHWIGTGHRHKLAVDLSSQWVWDYQRDGFVHHSEPHDESPGKNEAAAGAARLLRGRALAAHTFSPLDVAAAGDAGEDDGLKPAGPRHSLSLDQSLNQSTSTVLDDDDKAERITTEYVGLLSSQLESQRQYFAEMAASAKAHAQARMDRLRDELAATLATNAMLEKRLVSDAAAAEEAVKTQRDSTDRLSDTLDGLRAERSRCQKLMADQAAWQARLAQARSNVETALQERRERISRLKEENADLNAALAMQRRISSAPAEVQRELMEGTLVAADPPVVPSSESAHGQRRRRSRDRGGRY
eukprot:m.203376 g.203376  ORF g.203376 m.203376 type:complete len:697 (+) comp22109_c0_seq1:100-2190(+)